MTYGWQNYKDLLKLTHSEFGHEVQLFRFEPPQKIRWILQE